MRTVSRVFVLLFILFAVPAAGFSQTLTGRIVDAETGAPLPARLEIADSRVAATAGPDGRFTLDVGAATRVTIVIAHPGYYVQRSTIEVTAAALDVRLAPIVTVNDRVEVTAGRAREGTDAATFTNVPQQQIADSYWAQDPAMLMPQLVPNMFASNDNGNGIGYSYFSIRGFGQARTRVMLNGAPLNDAESGELFFIDLADFMSTAGDVQVKRGVTGLSGLGGALDFTTALPGVSPAFSLQVGAGSYGTRRMAFQWSSGLVGGAWAFDARYSKITSDGYRDQSWTDMWNYYFALARYGERSRVRVILFGGPEQTHLAYNGIDKATLEGGITGDAERDRRTNPLSWPGEIDNFFQPHYQFVHDITFSERTHFSQTVYGFLGDGYYDQFRANRNLYEYDLPNFVVPGAPAIKKSDLVRRRNVDEWDAGWVPAFSHQRGKVTVDLTGEWRIHRAHHDGEVTWAQSYPVGVAPNHHYYDYKAGKNTITGSAEARFAASEKVSLSGGLQVSRHTYKRISDDLLKGVAFTTSFNFVLPRAGAVVKLGQGGDAYANVARGMREPFLRSIYDPEDYYAAAPADLNPEDVWNVELGTSWRRDRWRLRANVFWMYFLNEIVYAGALDDNGVPVYGNGAKSRRRGLELDGSVNLTKRIGVDGTLSFSRNTFVEYRENDWSGGVNVYDGNRVAGFPDFMTNLSAHADIGTSRVSLALRHVGQFYLDNTQSAGTVNPAYTTVDASARIPLSFGLMKKLGLGRSALDLRVNNLFDARYTSFGYVDGGALYIPAAGRNLYAGVTLGF